MEWEYAEWFWLPPPDTFDAYKFEVCPYLPFLKLWTLFISADLWASNFKIYSRKMSNCMLCAKKL